MQHLVRFKRSSMVTQETSRNPDCVTDALKVLGEEIRRRRVDLQLTQEELAERSGLH